ncbi:sensor histidine kinase [Alteribacillus bidgolensis]|nr:HAMP domain-containing sensor histidine kinase [Alteribacillus bidgolensis]
MRWNRISIKMGASIIFLLLTILLPLGFVIDQVVYGFYVDEEKQEMEKLSSRYASAIAHSNNRMMVQMVTTMADFSQIPLYVTDEEGQIIANAGVPGITVGSSISEEDLVALSGGETITKEYKAGEGGEKFLVSGQAMESENTFMGGVFVLSSVESIDQSIQRIRLMLTLSGVGVFFLALGLTLVLSRKLSDPLVHMERATRHIAKGDLKTRVHVSTRDETGSLAQAINDLAVDLQRYQDSRREFFANVSHELRTPITYLGGYARIVNKGLYESEEEKEKYLAIMQKEATRLKRMIEDLFDLAKMEEGKVDLEMEAIDIKEVLENVVERMQLRAEEKGIDMISTLENNVPFLYGDGMRMEQIFYNLLENALRYTEDGTVTVDLKLECQERVLISIEDTGIGIPAEEQPYIFERFYRVEKSRARKYGGTGLGLAITKELIELQGGSIAVSSQEGKGTRFDIRFPIIPDEKEEQT